MNWLSYKNEERKILLRETARTEHLPEYAVEKDWWVTMTLKAIFNTEYHDYMVF